jgi:hypothetical protein
VLVSKSDICVAGHWQTQQGAAPSWTSTTTGGATCAPLPVTPVLPQQLLTEQSPHVPNLSLQNATDRGT